MAGTSPAMTMILERCKLLAEPSGAAALAGLLSGGVKVQADAPVAIILSGGNIDFDRFRRWVGPEVAASTADKALV